MTDRNNPPFSKAFYEEIEEEVQKVIQKNFENSTTDVELIRAHLKCLEGAFHQYIDQVERILERIETRNHLKEIKGKPGGSE